ncbi:MAG: acyl-CoA dehydrogenase [Chloroflexota bacterium]|nr:MAG: acyl-CoA dehydrogenase [Chloroflexota bacterium]
MSPLLSEDEALILQTVKKAAAEKIAPRAAEIDELDTFPADLFDLFRELGLFGLPVPEEYGGVGARTILFCKVIEEIAAVSLSAANILTQQTFGIQFLLTAGNEEQKKRFLPGLASGELHGAGAITEPEAGSDQEPMRTTALVDGDQYVLNGNKCFITWANIADVMTVFAKTQPELGRRGISAILFERGTPGMRIGRLEKKMGLRGSPTAEVVFENCRVPRSNLLGAEGDGFKIAMKSLNHGRLAIAALAIGLAQGALDYAWSYAKNRVQFGHAVSEFQGLRFLVAERATEIEAARSLAYRAGMEYDVKGPALPKLAAMTKLFATDVAMRVTVDAVQLLGGYGYTREYPVERMMRDAKILQIVEGTNQIQKVVISNHL